jgi:hypothetical protein
MKKKLSAILITGLMLLASLFAITTHAETIPEEEMEETLDDVEETTLDGFGRIEGYVLRIGILGYPVGVSNANVKAKSAFGTVTDKTNAFGKYVLFPLPLSKKGWAYYDVTINVNGYEMTEEKVYVNGTTVWLNFSLPSGFDDYNEAEELPTGESSSAEQENEGSSSSNSDENQDNRGSVENKSSMGLIARIIEKIMSFFR